MLRRYGSAIMANTVMLEGASVSERDDDYGDPFAFSIVTGETVHDLIAASFPEIVNIVRAAYLAHAEGVAINPPSYFLRLSLIHI